MHIHEHDCPCEVCKDARNQPVEAVHKSRPNTVAVCGACGDIGMSDVEGFCSEYCKAMKIASDKNLLVSTNPAAYDRKNYAQ